MQNYIKKSTLLQEVNPLFTHLLTRMPNKVSSWSNKEHFHLRGSLPSVTALTESKWLEYNQSWVNMLIIDIDRPISLDEAIKECLEIGYEPTWICKTDNGIHVCFTLENMVKYEWKNAIKLARLVKIRLTEKLNADRNASHRLNGIYRNPFVHEHYFSGLLYSLADFKKHLLNADLSPKKSFKKYLINQKKNNTIYKYELGYRNDFIFRYAMLESKDKQLTSNETLELINNIVYNESLKTGLPSIPICEIEAMARSVKKYNDKDLNFVSSMKPRKEVNRGKMGFEPICRGDFIDPQEHKRITKERQKLSAEITNKGRNMATRTEHILKVNAEKAEATKRKIINAMTGKFADDYKKKNGSWNALALSATTGVNEKTVRKYLKEVNND